MTSRMNRGVLFSGATEASSALSYIVPTSPMSGFSTSSEASSPIRALDPDELRKRARELERKLDLCIDNVSENENVEDAYAKVREADDILKQARYRSPKLEKLTIVLILDCIQLQDITKQMNGSGAGSAQTQHHLEKQRQFAQQLTRFRTRLDEKRARAALFAPSSYVFGIQISTAIKFPAFGRV